MSTIVNSHPEVAERPSSVCAGGIWANAIQFGAYVDGEYCDSDRIDRMRKYEGDFGTAVNLMGLPTSRMLAVSRLCYELSEAGVDPDSRAFRELYMELALLDRQSDGLGLVDAYGEMM